MMIILTFNCKIRIVDYRKNILKAYIGIYVSEYAYWNMCIGIYNFVLIYSNNQYNQLNYL